MDLATRIRIAAKRREGEAPTALPLEGATQAPIIDKADCPLCGFQFAKAQAGCCGCAMMRGCSMIKCPNCHYEFVTESKAALWIHKIWKRLDRMRSKITS